VRTGFKSRKTILSKNQWFYCIILGRERFDTRLARVKEKGFEKNHKKWQLSESVKEYFTSSLNINSEPIVEKIIFKFEMI
jgi:hypothetical protein